MSYTYAVLELSQEAYEEIKRKLRQAGYSQAIVDGPGGEIIDMTGVSVKSGQAAPRGFAKAVGRALGQALDDADRGSKPLDVPPSQGGATALERRMARDTSSRPSPRNIPNAFPPANRDFTKRARPPAEIDVTKVEFMGPPGSGVPVFRTKPKRKRDKEPPRDVPHIRAAPRPPAPIERPAVRVAIKADDGRILAVDRGDGEGFNLPGGPVQEGESPEDAAARILGDQVGLEVDDLIKGWTEADLDKWAPSTFFMVHADDGIEFRAEDGCTAEFIKMSELMCGTWGLAARAAFNSSGWIRRPELNWNKVYDLSDRALRGGSHREEKGVNEIIDEITFLTDIGKTWMIDDLIEVVDVTRLHADVADTLAAMLEPIDGLIHKPRVMEELETVIDAVDGLRTPIRFGPHEDVRAAARKIYRARRAEFSKMLRDGTLAEKFGGRHRGGKATTEVPDDAHLPPINVSEG